MIKKLSLLLLLISGLSWAQTVRTIENPPVDLIQCDFDNDGFGSFSLNQNDAVVIGSQNPSDVSVSYFETQADADTNNAPIGTPNSYNNIIPNIQTVYVRVDELASGMFDIDSFDLVVLSSPEPNLSPDDYILCDTDNDGVEIFDLTSRETEILDGLDPAIYDIVWYSDLTLAGDASGIEPASDIIDEVNYVSSTSFPLPDFDVVFARVINTTQSPTVRCFVVVSLDLVVASIPTITAPAGALELCDDNTDEIAVFDLTILDGDITGGDPTLTVAYYVSQNDLDNDLAIPNPSSYSNVINPQTIQILVTNSEGCTAQTSVILSVQPLPVPATIPAVETCDDDSDGFSEFDLAAVAVDIANGEPNVTVSFHETQADADSNQAALAAIYTNTSTSNQTLYARVTNDISSCYVVITVDLIVNTTIAASPTDLSECDDNGDSMEVFDLTQNDSVVTGSQNPADMTITYFVTLIDAEANVNAIASPSSFTNTTNPQTLFIRAENSVTGCSSVATFDIEVDDCSMDADGDGIPDADEDLNGNGNLDDDDTDGDTIPNYQDDDDDGDLVLTQDEIEGIGAGRNAFIDTDDDMIENYLDDDDDGDGILTKDEDYNGNGDPLDDDTNSNNIPDFLEEDVALGVAENVFSVSVYPNPTQNSITIESNHAFAKAELFNLQGQRVYTLESVPQLQSQINLTALPSGIYFLSLDGQTALRILKE